MATAAACTALADAFADLTRSKRTILGDTRAASGLALLAAVGHLDRPRASDLADHLGLDLSTVSRHVAGLRRQGYLCSAPSEGDARSQPLVLTPEGAAELDRRRQALAGRLVAQLGSWDDGEVTSLADLLHHFVASTSPTGTDPAGSSRA